MVEVFITNVETKAQAEQIKEMLWIILGYERVNFDLGDCDKILRIDEPRVETEHVIGILVNAKFYCKTLED